ncbi:MAG: Fic family protein [Balneolaceae bacterium]|nr:Fic family protein [Balneolaceae bacterium]
MANFLDDMPEVFVSHTDVSSQVSQAVSRGELKKIGSRLYTKNLKDDPEVIVKRHWVDLLSEYYPDALIADRTALENKPAEDGSVFIISSKKRITEVPGLIFNPRKGHGPLESDRPFISGLYISSEPRAYLENMRPSRARKGSVPRTLRQEEMEERLDRLFRVRGSNHVNRIRDRAREVAQQLDMQEEYENLDDLIGSMQGTRDANIKSSVGKARKSKKPYDPDRVDLFLKLFEDLSEVAPQTRSAINFSQEGKVNLSFFEAYFSNFIEGTEFEVDEAADIVFNNTIPAERPEDAHDVMGTFRIISNYSEMAKTPEDFDGFIASLRNRHSRVMALRKDKKSGEFKTTMNVAGSTQFVKPELVTGTLERGFEIYRGLEYPFQKAVFIMFLVSEVHPFTDGNGRIARIMMNAELVAADQQKIIIPTVYRNNYLAALRALTHNRQSDALIRTLDFGQKYVQAINWDHYDDARAQIEATHAFMDPAQADQEGIRLRLPS